MEKSLGAALSPEAAERVLRGMDGLKPRAKDLNELAAGAMVYAKARPLAFDDKATAQRAEGRDLIAAARPVLAAVGSWSHDALEAAIRDLAEANGLKLGKVAQPLRAAITGSTVSPPLFEVMEILGREECLARLDDAPGLTCTLP
jgi:glutamyl-tRNA synthetase